MRIGVLALQGAFIEHEEVLAKLNVEHFQIRQLKDIDAHFDGLIIPGGESTVQGKLLQELSLLEAIKDKIIGGLPVYGTCAGLLLLAKKISNDANTHIATMDITAVRNAYGRQLGSFSTEAEFAQSGKIPMVFIRAPYIESVSNGTQVLAVVDDKIVAARQGNQLVTSFHPELTKDYSVHKYFIEIVKAYINTQTTGFQN